VAGEARTSAERSPADFRPPSQCNGHTAARNIRMDTRTRMEQSAPTRRTAYRIPAGAVVGSGPCRLQLVICRSRCRSTSAAHARAYPQSLESSAHARPVSAVARAPRPPVSLPPCSCESLASAPRIYPSSHRASARSGSYDGSSEHQPATSTCQRAKICSASALIGAYRPVSRPNDTTQPRVLRHPQTPLRPSDTAETLRHH